MTRTVNANCAYARLSDNIALFARRGVNPEVFFSADALDSLDLLELEVQSDRLKEAGLVPTIHAAFVDLNPGTLDAAIRKVTQVRFEQIFEAATILRPRTIVFHPGYDDLRYGDYRSAWLENSVRFWNGLLPCAREINTVIAVENIFEKEPSTLRDLFEAVNDPLFGNCFDVGHWNMFKSVSMEEWFAALGRYVVEAHIHDNHGRTDEHLPLGEGEINFDLLFSLLKRYAPDAVWTIEAHTDERRERALENIQKYIES
jgi:sugar phosphate isomerase/epimerase